MRAIYSYLGWERASWRRGRRVHVILELVGRRAFVGNLGLLLSGPLRLVFGLAYISILAFLARCGLLLVDNASDNRVESARIFLVSLSP